MARPVKPFDINDDEQRAAAVEHLLALAGVRVGRRVKRRWVRSSLTDAIVNGGPNWKPNQPFTDYVRNQRRLRETS